MNTVSLLRPYFERYITLERVHPVATYDYKARGFSGLPVIEITMHKPKCPPDSWLYIAIPATADLGALKPTEKLYVGSQTGDRMFRGDGMGGRNFHHAQMRAGNENDNPIDFLRYGKKVTIYRISAAAIATAVSEVPSLSHLEPLLRQSRKHIGYWFEQFILHSELGNWRWNTAPADGTAQTVFRAL